jgi:hypothetical protein
LAIEPLIHCIARTGLFLTWSAGLLLATFLSEFAVAAHDHLLDFFNPQLITFLPSEKNFILNEDSVM